MIAGVDGYPDGWVAAIDRGGGTTAVAGLDSFSALLAREDLCLIVIDIPIGLLQSGSRRCDLEARRMLGFPRRLSVFPALMRPMIKARDWQEACDIRLRIEGKRCNRQVPGMLPKTRDVDGAMGPELQHRVREGHPEVSFALRNGGRAMRHRKSTPQGRRERLRLLKRHCTDVVEKLASPSVGLEETDAGGTVRSLPHETCGQSLERRG